MNTTTIPPTYSLWHRPGRGQPWRRLHTGTQAQCSARELELIRHGLTGDLYVGTADPNRPAPWQDRYHAKRTT